MSTSSISETQSPTPVINPVVIVPKKSHKMLWIIIIVVIVLLLLCCCSVFIFIPKTPVTSNSGNTTDTTNNTEPTATTAPAAKIGDTVKVDSFQYKILTAKNLGDTLTSTNQFTDPKKTSGKWISVRFEIENTGTSSTYLTNPTLIDGKGVTYEASSDGIYFVPSDEYPLFEQINPGITKTYTLIYDVPTASTGLQMTVGVGSLTGGTNVDLGL